MKTKVTILKDLLCSIAPIPDDEWPELEKNCKSVSYKKGDILLRAGDLDSRVGLIVKGLVKRSYNNPDGKEFVQYFGREGRFSGTYSSILTNEISKVTITALEDTELIAFDFHAYQRLYARHKCWERIVRIIIEQLFMDRERREYQLLMLDAQARYQEFLKEFQDCHQRITNKDIASYLRITPETFSRLRS